MAAINTITREDVEQFAFLAKHSVEFDAMYRYQEIATGTAIYPGQGTPLGLAYVALKLNGEAGEFAEHVGKAMRDDGFGQTQVDTDYNGQPMSFPHDIPLTNERRDLIIKEIGDVLWYISAACNELGISLSEAATINLEKLCDRAERNALRGSGDNR